MCAAACLLAVLVFAAAGTAAAKEKPAIDRMRPGSLNPEPLPPPQNPNAPSTPAKELFARKSKPLRGPPRSIGYYSAGCLAGAVALPMTGPDWQVMRPSRNRNWGSPQLVRFVERLAKNAKKGRLERSFGRGHVAAARRTDDLRPHQPSNRPRRRYLVQADAEPRAKPGGT